MIGLKRGTVALLPHREEWDENAAKTIVQLKEILGNAAVDIQHIGSTAVSTIHAKPILDIAIGVGDLQDVLPCIPLLEQHGFIFRGEVVAGQRLFVMGDSAHTIRTHHIHVVKWNGTEWNNYIAFRDYLRAFPEKAAAYDACKRELALRFPKDRKRYTDSKQEIIDRLLQEARAWKSGCTR